MGAKKAANLFRIYCFMCRCGAAGYSVSMLSVKPELEQAFNQLCSDVVLHIRVVIAVHLREVADIFSHGKSPFLRLWERAAALLAVAP